MEVSQTKNEYGTVNLNYQTDSKNTHELVADLETVLEKLNSKEFINCSQLLFYIDGTNGFLIITGYDEKKGEAEDDKIVEIELQELWEDNENSMDCTVPRD